MTKHEEVLPHQKQDSHPILADSGTDQFSIRTNDKGSEIFVKPLNSLSFKSVTPFQTEFKTPIKKNNKYLHQQSLLLNDTDITSDDEEHMYSILPKHNSTFTTDTTIEEETFSTIKNHYITRINFCKRCTNKFSTYYTLFTNHTFDH